MCFYFFFFLRMFGRWLQNKNTAQQFYVFGYNVAATKNMKTWSKSSTKTVIHKTLYERNQIIKMKNINVEWTYYQYSTMLSYLFTLSLSDPMDLCFTCIIFNYIDCQQLLLLIFVPSDTVYASIYEIY